MKNTYEPWLNINLKDYYYNSGTYFDSSRFKIYLEPEKSKDLSILVFLDEGPVYYLQTEESSRMDWAGEEGVKTLLYRSKDSDYIDFILN